MKTVRRAVDDGGRSDLRSRWWPIPGMVAILGSLAVVAATQGWLRAAPVDLPRAVQVGVHLEANVPEAAAAGAPSVPATVVPPSRPVVSDPPSVPDTHGVRVASGASATIVPDATSTTAPASEPTTDPAHWSGPSSDDSSAGSSDDGAPTTPRTTTATTTTTFGVTTTTAPAGPGGD